MRASGRSDRRRRIECSARRQGLDCDAPSFFADVIEEQIGGRADRLRPSRKRAGRVDRALAGAARDAPEHGPGAGAADPEGGADQTLYLEGDLDEAEYRRQRAEVAEALASIPPDELPTSEAVGKRLAALLADLSMAWTVATPEERNKIARQLFADVVVENRTAVAVKPRPELAPFFESLAVNPDPEITPKRKRRASVAHCVTRRFGRPALAKWSACLGARRIQLNAHGTCRSTSGPPFRALARTKSLRSLAAEFGVSHETVRCVLRKAEAARRLTHRRFG